MKAPSGLSIFNIHVNKYKDNNIINLKPQNSNSFLRTKSNPRFRTNMVQQNLKNILTSKTINSKKDPVFFRSKQEKEYPASNILGGRSTFLQRNSSQKSTKPSLGSAKISR